MDFLVEIQLQRESYLIIINFRHDKESIRYSVSILFRFMGLWRLE